MVVDVGGGEGKEYTWRPRDVLTTSGEKGAKEDTERKETETREEEKEAMTVLFLSPPFTCHQSRG